MSLHRLWNVLHAVVDPHVEVLATTCTIGNASYSGRFTIKDLQRAHRNNLAGQVSPTGCSNQHPRETPLHPGVNTKIGIPQPSWPRLVSQCSFIAGFDPRNSTCELEQPQRNCLGTVDPSTAVLAFCEREQNSHNLAPSTQTQNVLK